MTLIDRDAIESRLIELKDIYSKRIESYRTKQMCVNEDEAKRYADLEHEAQGMRMAVCQVLGDLCSMEEETFIPLNRLGGLNVRSYNQLVESGIYTIQDLQKMTVDDLMKIKNIGKKTVRNIADSLKEIGLCLRGSENETD